MTDWKIVGVREGATAEEIDRAFKKRALLTHPDRGGDPEAFRTLVEARDRLLAGAPTVHHEECPECRGAETVKITRGFYTLTVPCPRCQVEESDD